MRLGLNQPFFVQIARPVTTSIAVAPDGAVWAGTLEGLSRFDGVTWTTYTKDDGLASNSVDVIFVTSDGTLWVGTSDIYRGSLSYFDGRVWTTYTHDNLRSNYIRSIASASDGVLWLGCRWGLLRFDGETWISYDNVEGVNAIAIAPNGVVWFARIGSGGGVSCFDGEAWATYTTDDDLVSNWVNAIAVDHDGTLWFGTNNGISRFDGETWVTFTTNDGLVSNHINVIVIDPDDAVWFGTESGVSRYVPID